MSKQPTSFRLESQCVEDLKWLAKRMHRSQSEVIEALVRDRKAVEEEEDTSGRLRELEARVERLERGGVE